MICQRRSKVLGRWYPSQTRDSRSWPRSGGSASCWKKDSGIWQSPYPKVLTNYRRLSVTFGSAVGEGLPSFCLLGTTPPLPQLPLPPCDQPTPALLAPPLTSGHDADIQQPKRRDNVISPLSMFIDVLNLTKEMPNITPAKAVFGSVSILLVMIRVYSLLSRVYVPRIRLSTTRTTSLLGWPMLEFVQPSSREWAGKSGVTLISSCVMQLRNRGGE